MFDIDMQSYGSGPSNPPSQPAVDHNSYQPDEGDGVRQDLLEQPMQQAEESRAEQVNPGADNFRALREEVDRIKAEREAEKRDYQLQIDVLRANMVQPQAQKLPEAPQKRMFEGMQDNDVPSVAEIRQEWGNREAEYQARLEELQVQQAHPDYAEVIEKYALPLVRQKPHLLQGIQHSSNKALMAYELGKMAQQMQQVQQTQPKAASPSVNAQRMVDNSRKQATLSQAGGQSALSQADFFASMSDAEFMKMASKNMEGI